MKMQVVVVAAAMAAAAVTALENKERQVNVSYKKDISLRVKMCEREEYILQKNEKKIHIAS